jgi:hypothetical protein
MFNFTTLVLYSLLSLGIGYSVGNARKFGFFKFLLLIFIIIPLVYLEENKFYMVGFSASFILGFLYAHSYLFDDFFTPISLYLHRRASKKEERKFQKQKESKKNKDRDKFENKYKQREEDLHRREQEQRRRSEEARKTRQEQANKNEEKSNNKRTPQEILGLNPGFSKEELKEAYRRESSRTHPDKWTGKPEKIREIMEEEQKLLNWAYNKLK